MATIADRGKGEIIYVSSPDLLSPQPRISVCVAVKNRSRVAHDGQELHLFPNSFHALSHAAKLVGSVELVVADFLSDDWPLCEWLHSADQLTVKVISVPGVFSRGRGLNVAAWAASSSIIFLTDADILIDADALLRGIESVQLGRARFPICQFLNQTGSPHFWQDPGKGLAFISKVVLEECQGVPEFESWGGEDDLFFELVQSRCPIDRDRDPGIQHQWHPELLRHVHYHKGNKADFHSQSTHILNSRIAPVRARFEAIHTDWGGRPSELILRTSGRFERSGGDAGSYEWTEYGELRLNWDRWPPESLHWDGATQLYRALNKRFTLRRIESIKDIVQELRSECHPLATHLHSLGDLQYIDCGGNRGDQMIRAGTLAFLRSIGVKFREVSPSQAQPGLPAVLSGSGGFCRFWSVAPKAAEELAERCRTLVVLPSTYEELSLTPLRRFNNVFLYSRERRSLEEIGAATPAAFCPDLAFWVDVPQDLKAKSGVGYAFRTDSEGYGFGAAFDKNRDLSITGTWAVADFLRDVSEYEVLHTDRTHVAVAAILLGREVHLYPNRYHKNIGYFEAYLRRLGCVWHDAPKDRISRSGLTNASESE